MEEPNFKSSPCDGYQERRQSMEAKMIKTFVKLFICISFIVLFSSVDTMSQEKTLIIGVE